MSATRYVVVVSSQIVVGELCKCSDERPFTSNSICLSLSTQLIASSSFSPFEAFGDGNRELRILLDVQSRMLKSHRGIYRSNYR